MPRSSTPPPASQNRFLEPRCVLAAVSLLAAAACSAPTPSTEEIAAEEVPLRLYVFDCGELRFEDVGPFGLAADETDVREMFVPCYVVEHPTGRLLWDGGLASGLAEQEDWVALEGFGGEMRLARTFADQLAELDLALTDIGLVAFSHLHFDHVGVANEMAHAKLLIQRPEHDAGFAEEMTIPGADRSLYDGLTDSEKLILDGRHDVFGDGRVLILPAPGHTPGHQVLFVDLAKTGPLLLSGDLYHFRASRELRRPPVFNVDPEQSIESMEAIESFIEERGATLWIEHDMALAKSLNLAPAFYD